MEWKQAQTAIVAGVVILMAGFSAIALEGNASQQEGKDAWQVNPADWHWLENAPPQVVVRPTKFPDVLGNSAGSDDQVIGIAMPARSLILAAYQVNEQHAEFATELPDGKYDYIANLPTGSGKALQQEINKQLGITGRFEPRQKDVLVLKVRDANSLKLTQRKSFQDKAGMWFENNSFHWAGQPSGELANWLEGFFKMPVVDNTGLTNLHDYNFNLKWTEKDLLHRDSEKLQQALAQAGFDLIPTNQVINTLIIEKAH